MSVDVGKRRAGFDCDDYVPIALGTLCPTPALDFDLYIRPDESSAVVLYRERSYPLESEDLARLSERGLTRLYITWESQKAYRNYLFDNVVTNSGADPKQRYQVLTTATRAAFDAAFRSISPSHMVEFAEEFGTHMVDIVCSSGILAFDLLSLMQHDHYTYTHSVNVCTCAVALANMLWDDPKADLKPIAKGAILHDIGKRRIPGYVVRKRGPLTPEERELVRQHPVTGFEELCLRDDVTWGGLMAVHQHHERVDGGGYPSRMVGDEIHELGRICAIADVFDARLSDRPYHKATPLTEVLGYLESQAGQAFDREMVRCWNSAFKNKH